MNIQELHERFDTWTYDKDAQDIVLRDVDNKELDRLDVNYLIELWFNERDAE